MLFRSRDAGRHGRRGSGTPVAYERISARHQPERRRRSTQRRTEAQQRRRVGGVLLGTRLVLDQAECAFRAFAAHRLDVRVLEMPSETLDGRDRGSLLHSMMEQLWLGLKDSAALHAALSGDPARGGLQEVLEQAAARAVQRWRSRRPQALGEREAALQQQRLVDLVGGWLQHEAQRAGFEVLGTELGQTLQAGGISVQGRLRSEEHTSELQSH